MRFLKFPDLDHLDKEHTLTEEEMSAFENALIAVMVGGVATPPLPSPLRDRETILDVDLLLATLFCSVVEPWNVSFLSASSQVGWL